MKKTLITIFSSLLFLSICFANYTQAKVGLGGTTSYRYGPWQLVNAEVFGNMYTCYWQRDIYINGEKIPSRVQKTVTNDTQACRKVPS
ncbi:hypothetical protein DM558_11265 [Entomomonas moraniae]|uniref:Secreted protein n=1 Tax=Entomomonas moraniae TaxID=2213226 RepID=A0A3Q9JJU9_9GAMM|nr:hypothetical protein [Entomomonas moraniae]AZS51311.1 hypothetical protein DM558_11265 [Entomomonas moraniae]